MDLPNEIILLILKSLRKCDLKSARLVSKTWTAFAAELLFDQAYVSVHPENLEVFRAITQHALLSNCVKTLRYDTVDFVEDYTKYDYTRDLWIKTRRLIVLTDPCPKSFEALSSDPEINTWMNLIVADKFQAGRSGHNEWRTVKDFQFIDYGYHKYQRYAALQRAKSTKENFVETLVGGLQKLKNLSCVIVDDRWPFPRHMLNDPKKLFLKRPIGSLLARNWSMFHTYPQNWESMPQEYSPVLVRGATDGADHYWTITCALIRSQRKIQTFQVGNNFSHSIPAYVFDRSQVKSLSFHGLDIAAFSGLKKLSLSIAPYGDEKTSEFFPNMDGLRFLLGSMHHLEALDLDLPGDPEDKPTFYTYDQIFPKEGQWSQLRTLSLQHFASSATDLLTLLIRRTSNLTQLQLGMVELLTGNWQGVIECMMQSMHLLRFDIVGYTEFWHLGGTEFLSKHFYERADEIGVYVEDGGRHPCLRSDQPDSAAQKYVTQDLVCFSNAVSSAQEAYA